jgi:hypothetical protein
VIFSVLATMGLAFAAQMAHAAPIRAQIPVDDRGAWQDLTYRRIPPNAVEFSSSGMSIAVRSSASPLIHALRAPRRIKRVIVRLKLAGNLAKPAEAAKWDEDSQFRLGLVVDGDKRLRGLSRALAPDWVKRLFSLAQNGGGVDRILFLMIGRSPAKIGDSRLHPSSDLIEERITWLAGDGRGTRVLEADLDPPLPVSALWISADGDDTGSSYALRIESIELE